MHDPEGSFDCRACRRGPGHVGYHLRDYLAREGAASKGQRDELIASSQPRRVCRDPWIGAVHREIDRPSADPEPWILCECGGPGDSRVVVKAGEKFDLVSVSLANDCMKAWDSLLGASGLDSHELSGTAARIAAILRDHEASR